MEQFIHNAHNHLPKFWEQSFFERKKPQTLAHLLYDELTVHPLPYILMALIIETRLPRLLGRLPRALKPLGERALS
jgi:hypothetical protein